MPGDENYLDNLLKSMNEKEAEMGLDNPNPVMAANTETSDAVLDRLRAFSQNSHDGFSVFSEPEPEVVEIEMEDVPMEAESVSEIGSVSAEIESASNEQPPKLATDLTPEEIAAIFAPAEALAKEYPLEKEVEESVVEPVPEIEIEEPIAEPVIEEPIAEPVIEEPIAEFVIEEPVIEPVVEPIAEEPVVEPVIEESAPIEVTPVSDDPNAALTPEQIAAMFASVETPAEEPIAESVIEEPVIEPEVEPVAEEPAPIEVTPVSDDPNAALTPEQIAAMFASVEAPAEEPVAEPVIEEPVIESVVEPVAEEPAPIEVTPVSDDPNAALTPEQIAAMFASVETPAEEPIAEPVIEEPIIEPVVEPVAEEPAPIEVTPVSDDPNAALTPEQIAAMFASVETPAEEPIAEPVIEEPVIESVVEPVAEEPTPIEVTPVSDDPNAALTPEQIAAMFASVETPAEEPIAEPVIEEPVIESVVEPIAEEPVVEPVIEEPAPIEVTPVSDDPNAALTPEQIAAMFASVEAPAEEPIAESVIEEPVIESVVEPVAEEPAPIEVTPVSDDPNAALTPEQIAAMFASVEAPAEEPIAEPAIEEPVIEPEVEPVAEEPAPIEVTPVSDDPNAALTPEQIAAMFASVEAPAEEPIAESVIEEPVIESVVEPVAEEPAPIEVTPVSDDPNAALTPEQIAAMFDSVDPSLSAEGVDELTIEEIVSQSSMGAEFDTLLSNEELEVDLDNMDLLNQIGERPSADLDDFTPEEDINLNEIEDLLNMSDNHEMVDDDMGGNDILDILGNGDGTIDVDEMDIDALLESADTVHRRSSEGDGFDDEADEEEPDRKRKKKKKVKKEKVKKEKKVKKSRKTKTEETEVDSEGFNIDEIDIDFGEGSENKTKGRKGFFSKILDALTEEEEDDEPLGLDIPEKPAGEENIAILNELEAEDAVPQKSKGKKEKKSKKDKENDPKAKAKEEAAKAKKEAAAKAKKEKAQAAKEAKAKKAEEKAKKEAELGPIKKLPKKKVILIFCIFVPILAGLLAIGVIIPADAQRKEARSAYKVKDYTTVYENMYGQKLNEEDQRMFDNSSAILQMQRWLDAFYNYRKLDMPRESLDALISGVNCYNNLLESGKDLSDVAFDIRGYYDTILTILSDDYGVSESYAKAVTKSETPKEYTAYIDGIISGNKIGKVDEPTAETDSTEDETNNSEAITDVDVHGDTPPTPEELQGGDSEQGDHSEGETDNSGDSEALIYEIYSQ